MGVRVGRRGGSESWEDSVEEWIKDRIGTRFSKRSFVGD